MAAPCPEKDLKHVEGCHLDLDECFQCRFIQHRDTWQRKLPWLIEKGEGKTWGLYCKLCCQHVPEFAFGKHGFNGPGNFFTVSRHQRSKQHLLSLDLAGLDGVDNRAPSNEEFQSFASKRLTAKSLRSMETSEEAKGRWKLTRLQACLGEAMRQRDRDFLVQCTAIALHQDVRRLVLMIRFRACSYHNLEVRRGLLGCCNLQDGTSESLQAGCLKILAEFAGYDSEMMQMIQDKVVLLNADAAADEQLAMRLMAAGSGLFQNAVACTRDRTHAARRILKRPFAAVPEIWDVFNSLVWNNAAMPTTIQSSDVLRNVFNKYIKLSESELDGSRIKSLSLRKQRFDSHQKVTGRLILWLRATVMTAVYASVHRRTERDGQRAMEFLRNISEEKVVLLAMLADFSDEATAVIRMLDSENSDVASHQLELDAFASRVKHLFIDQKALKSGYTEMALVQLKRPIAFDVDGAPKCLGGADKVSDAMIARCFHSMKTLVALSTEVIEAEFPAHQLISAFNLFNVTEAARGSRYESVDFLNHLRISAEKLCNVFEGCVESFLQEYWDHKAIAFHHASTTPSPCSSFESWAFAIKRTSARKETAARHPSETLRWIVAHFGALDGATTSGVEQDFSRMVRIVSAERSLLSEENQGLELKFMLDFNPSLAGEIIPLARGVWLSRFGAPRKGSKCRIDKGTKRPQKNDSEAAFLSKRRCLDAPVELLSNDAVRRQASDFLPANGVVQKELVFQRNKQFKNTIQSYLAGHLTGAEVPDGLVDVAQEFAANLEKQDRERTRDASRKASLLAPQMPRFDMRTQWVYLQDPAWSEEKVFRGCKTTDDLRLALFFVVQDPSSPPPAVKLAAAVRGGCVLDLECMRSAIQHGPRHRHQGVAFLYDAGYAIKRRIFVCPLFATKQPEMIQFLHAAVPLV